MWCNIVVVYLLLQHMQACPDVFGAGDIVRFPLPLIEGETNIGHWQIAHNHGESAII